MSFMITGLAVDQFKPLFGLSDEELNARGVIRKVADAKPGYPCRITLEDAEPGETVLLLNHEHHHANTPYRSSYAIYVNESAVETRQTIDTIPGVLKKRPLALRRFDADGMLIGASLDTSGDPTDAINQALTDPETDYIHIHNAMHGCFAAEARRAN